MTPERWQLIKEIFIAALSLSGSEREGFIRTRTEGDDELRREVDSLLVSDSHPDDGTEWNIASIITHESYQGKKIGAYTIVREIGRGGMGVVYEGLREEDFKQRVAIKVIRHGHGAEETLRRFHIERSALARLDHPGIARLLDGGNLPDGAPYCVMEYIEGIPIDFYCDEQKLDIRARLELFRSVCAAVHYAHQHLIVHRDLKPGNIFVTPNGVKLLDFGIAKLLDPGSSEASLSQTRQDLRFFTPEYASPEQILGGVITTASDTYSLGVLLYKLLTGRRPYRFKSPALPDIEQAVLQGQPTRPSRVVQEAGNEEMTNRATSSVKLSRILSGDLDTIVLKALQKEPERRYSSVQQLDEDIHRYLDGLPVSAQRDSLGYRVRKFVGRNKFSTMASAVALLMLIGGIGSSLWQASRAEHERDRAQAESEKAKQVIRVLNEMLSAADPTRATGRDVTVAQVLGEASQRVEREFSNQPEIAGDLLATIGASYQGLQLYDKAREAMEKTLEIQIALHGAEHPRVAEAMRALGAFHHLREERTTAESLYARSLAIFVRYDEPSREYATAMNDYAVFLQDEGRYDAADSLFRSALEMYRTLPGDNRKDIATSLHNLALNFDWQGELAIADSLYGESLIIQREVYGNNNVMIAFTISNRGYIAEAQGNLPEAERLFRESLQIRRSLLSDDHSDVAASKIRLGLFLVEHSTRYSEADTLCREALAALLAHHAGIKRLIAKGYLGLGRAEGKTGRLRQAEESLRQAVSTFEQMQPYSVQSIADAELYLVENLVAQHRVREAGQVLRQVMDRLAEARAQDSKEMKRAEGMMQRIDQME